MDDELKRKIAAALDLPDDAAADPAVVAALEKDPQAQAFARGLYAIEAALARWPVPDHSPAEWERFASDIEKRLGEAPWENVARVRGTVQPLAWDALDKPPLREDEPAGDAAPAPAPIVPSPRTSGVSFVKPSEHKSMPQSHDDKDNDDDLEGLAALTRTSSSPGATSLPPPTSIKPGPSLNDDDMDESSGIVDIQKLAAIALKQSVPPAARSLRPDAEDGAAVNDAAVAAGEMPTASPRKDSGAPAASAKAVSEAPAVGEAKRAESVKPAAVAAVPEKNSAKTVTAQPVATAPAARRRTSPVVWLVPLAAAAGVGWFALNNRNASTIATHGPDTSESAPAATAAAPSSAGAGEQQAQQRAQEAPAQPVAAPPAAQPAGPAAAAAEPAPANGVAAMAQTATPPPAAPSDNRAGAAATDHDGVANERARIGTLTERSAEGAAAAPTGGAPARRALAAGGAEAQTAAADTTTASTGTRGGRPAAHAAAPEPGAAAANAAPAQPTPPTVASATTTATSAPATRAPAATAPAPTTAGGHQGAAGAAPTAPGGSSGAASGGGGSSIDDLLRRATGGSTTAAAPREEAPAQQAAALPARPSRAQVSETMGPLASAVRACAQGATGTATVAMVVRSSGEVQSASVSGPFESTVTSCIQGVVRRAHFPQFSNPTVPIVYPFVIQPPRPGG